MSVRTLQRRWVALAVAFAAGAAGLALLAAGSRPNPAAAAPLALHTAVVPRSAPMPARTPTGRAWSWIGAQGASTTRIVSRSTITADRDYDSAWTGAVAGRFTPRGASSPVAHGVYTDWVVRAYVVTDVAYLVGTQPARADRRFSFPTSRPGTKVFQLVDRRGGAVLAEQSPDFGLVRSFAGSPATYTYDQALTVVAAVATRHPFGRLATGLISLQRPGGGFVESADARNPAAGLPVERTGICAVATYALLRAAAAMAPRDAARTAVLAAARSGLGWLQTQQRADGLLGAGLGTIDADGSVDPGARPGWVSTEHNLDAWQAIRFGARVFDDPALARVADRVRDAVLVRLWDARAGRFRQGIAADGSNDDADPLDVNAWGAIFAHDAGQPEIARRARAHLQVFASGTPAMAGYRSFYPQPAFPHAGAEVWTEGTAGVATAAARTGDAARAKAIDAQLARLQHADGALPCATRADPATGMVTAPCLAATAWFVLASTSGSIWA